MEHIQQQQQYQHQKIKIMTLIDFDKFLASFITEMRECSQMRNFSIPRCIKKALEDQGLEYKDGEIVKSQRIVSAEAKENGYGESDEFGENNLLSFIDSLEEEPEVDLEKEVKDYIYTLPHSRTGIPGGWKCSWNEEEVIKIVKHFLEVK